MATKPEKPLNGYFKFRAEKLAEFKDKDNKMALVKEAWQNLSDK